MIIDIGFILNMMTFGISIFTCLISLMIVIVIILHLRYNRMKQEEKVTIIVCINIYILLLVFITILVSFNIQTLLGDLYGQDFNSSWCIPIGYLSGVFLGTLYWGFVNQAFYRLCRVVYSTYRWLQFFWLYIIIAPIELILVSILFCPVLVWHGIIYVTKEHYCFLYFTNIPIVLWYLFNIYGTPLLLLSLIYLRITVFLRRQLNNQPHVVKLRQQRDLVVIRRILIIIGLLVTLGIPAIILLLILYITGEQPPLFYRIAWLAASLSMTALSLSMVVLTPQLKNIFLKKLQHNQIVPFNGNVAGPIQTRP